MTHPTVIDLAQAPYNVVPDWTGSDALATNYTTALNDALAEAATSIGATIDAGGTAGAKVWCSLKGGIMLDPGIIIPQGVELSGVSKYTTVFHFRTEGDPTKHLFTLGDPTTGLANFGSKLRHCVIHSLRNFDVAHGTAAIFSNNNQDTPDMMEHMWIFPGARAGVWYTIGYGGATGVDCHGIQCSTQWTTNPSFHFDGTDATSFRLDLLEPNNQLDPATGKGIEGSVGLELGAGRFEITRYHPELLHTGINFNITSGIAELRQCVGHPSVPFLFVVNKVPGQLNKITFKNCAANGSLVTVYNDQPTPAQMTYGDINAEIRM